ncbi:MAG: hypothetical protein RR307_05905 [Clostridia bacterium]
MRVQSFFNDLKYQIADCFSKNKIRLICYAIAIVIGFIVGAVYYKSISNVQLMIYNQKEWFLVVISGGGIFSYFWNFFKSAFALILIVGLASLCKWLSPIHYITAIMSGVAFCVAIITVVIKYSVVGIIFTIFVFLIYEIGVFIILAFQYVFSVKANDCCDNNFTYLKNKVAKIFIIAVIAAAVLSLVSSLIVVIIVKPLILFL